VGPPPPGAVEPNDAGGFATGGDRRSLRLHDHDEALIRAVAAANPRTVVVVVSGSAVVMEAWRREVPAIVQLWYSGMEGGHALADVLLGHVDATGRLPFSIPTDEAALPPFDPDADAVTYDAWHGYWLLERDGHLPAFPFGFGLSYTTWEIGHLTPTEGWDVQVEVRNTGPRDGCTVVQAYARRPGRPQRRLVGFQRVSVAAGGAASVTIPVAEERLATRADGAWHLAPGRYDIVVGFFAGAELARLTRTVTG
jgi:hypothetical protein